MYRMVYRVGLFLGAAILALFIGARFVNVFDPYRLLTEQLIADVAADPQKTVRLNEYGTLADQLRGLLHTEQMALLAAELDKPIVSTLLDFASFRADVGIAVAGLETAVAQAAELDATLVNVRGADLLSRDLARLRFYDLDGGAEALADLYRQSTVISGSLADVSDGLVGTATAVSTVTNALELEKLQQSLAKVGNGANSLVSQSLRSWIGLPENLRFVQQKIDVDVAWLNDFEQRYEQAMVINDQWHFNTLRQLPPFVAENYQPLLLGVIGSLLLALSGWMGSREQHRPQRRQAAPRAVQPRPTLAFRWANGRIEHQPLPTVGELTIGNIVIRRARVRYYLERLDNAFPAFLNGQSICGARSLNDGDVLQIGELQTVFQLAA
jgi:hypothetical protein